MSVYDVLIDFCFMSGLLIVAQFLRSKLKFLQNYYIPSSLIAGTIGLILGPQVLKVVPWSTEAASYPYLLICVIFGAIFLGKKIVGNKSEKSNVFKKVGDTFLINTACEILCFGIALLLGGILIVLFLPSVFPEFALLLPAGFAGGHGYAAAIGGALNDLLAREDAVSIGQVFATIGLLVGLIGGIICINISAKKGYTRFVGKAAQLPEDCRRGFILPENRASYGTATTHSMSINSVAWHLSFIFLATGIGYAVKKWLDAIFPKLAFPLMCLTMLAGLLIQVILTLTKQDKYIDKKVLDNSSGCMTDYLVAFGVATIKISVVAEFWVPIIIFSIIGIIWPVVIVFVVGKKLFRNFWFERSIFIFGYLTGIVAVGMTLLRCCDPESKSGTLDDFGYAYSIQSIIEVFFVALIPVLTVSWGWAAAGSLSLGIGIVLLVICALIFGISKKKGYELREGEAEIIGNEIGTEVVNNE